MVVIGLREDGEKELLALELGYRESAESWAGVLRTLRDRVMAAPVLVIGDGALGIWAALREVWPGCRRQRWCQTYATGLDLAAEYQPWVVSEFSGVLCVGEVYQGRLALLLAVAPGAPEGDRLVGYQLVNGTVHQTDVEQFLTRLRCAGIEPAQVVTDGSVLYPAVLARVWPTAARQRCLFPETRRVTRAVQEAIRATVSTPPVGHGDGQDLRGRPPRQPATADREMGGSDWHARRQSAMRLVHQLHQQGVSLRGVERQTGRSRHTVRRWVQEPMPAEAATVEEITTVCVSNDRCSEAVADALAGPAVSEAAPPTTGSVERAVPDPSPPWAPWDSWDEPRTVRQQLLDHRFLFVRRPDRLTAEEAATLDANLQRARLETLSVIRAFVVEWYAIWRDETGQRRSPEDAHRLLDPAVVRSTDRHRSLDSAPVRPVELRARGTEHGL